MQNAEELKNALVGNSSEIIVENDIDLSTLKTESKNISVNHQVTLKGAEGSKPTISGGTITFGADADNSTVSSLTFESKTSSDSVTQSIKILGASNVSITGCTFTITDTCTSDSNNQFTSIWIQNDGDNPSDTATIQDCTFNFSNCVAGRTNVAIAIQSLNNSGYPENVRIINNHFTSTVKERSKINNTEEPYDGNSVSILTLGAEGTLTITGNTFEEVGGVGYDQKHTSSYASMQSVELGGNVADAQISDNDFINSYTGITVYMQGYQDVQSTAAPNKATILNNRFTNVLCGILVSPDKNGKNPTTEKDFIASNNTYTGCKYDIENQSDDLIVANNDSVITEAELTIALQNAAELAKQGKEAVVKLGTNIKCSSTVTIPAGVTLDGGGHRISSVEGGEYTKNVLILVGQDQDGVTIQNLNVDATKGGVKHGIEFYCADQGTIRNVNVKGGIFTSIQANGAQITIDNCETHPSAGAYANIEYGMGSDVTEIPKITVSNMKSYDSKYPLIYMDQDTIDSVIKSAYPAITVPEDATAADRAARVLDFLNKNSLITVDGMKLVQQEVSDSTSEIPKYVIVTVEEPKPSTPSTGGSSSTQKPLEGISLGMTSAQVGPGDTLQMNVTYTPSDTTASKRVTWTSSDEDVVTVDRNGKVTATGKSGKATITATVGGKTATCTITINPFKVDVEDLNGAVTSCKADGSTVIKVPQSMSYNFDISSGVTLDSFDYTVGNDKVGGTNTITRWNGTSGKYQIYAAGAVGSQTGVYVNGVKLFTIEVTERPFTSDTTLDMSLKVGTPYMFRITPDDKNASFTFLTADGKALSTSYKAALYPDEKGDYYCTVTPLQANRDIGVYCVIGGNTYKVFTVHTIA